MPFLSCIPSATTIGFDRMLLREWMDAALHLAASKTPLADSRAALDETVGTTVKGPEARENRCAFSCTSGGRRTPRACSCATKPSGATNTMRRAGSCCTGAWQSPPTPSSAASRAPPASAFGRECRSVLSPCSARPQHGMETLPHGSLRRALFRRGRRGASCGARQRTR